MSTLLEIVPSSLTHRVRDLSGASLRGRGWGSGGVGEWVACVTGGDVCL